MDQNSRTEEAPGMIPHRPSAPNYLSGIGGLFVLGLATLCVAQATNGRSSFEARQFPAALSVSAPSAQQASQTRATLPRGKKLLLKDGSFQLVREYKIDGDRVRYYSLDTSQWEEMPAALVDWDATNAAEAEEAKRDAAAIAKVDTQEKALHAELTLDVDASLEVAPGLF